MLSIGLFIGIDENAPLYFVPLIGDKNEIDPYCINPEEVRMYNFRYLVKKQPEQESITDLYIIDMAEGNSVYLDNTSKQKNPIMDVSTHDIYWVT